jgi:hypothetical protein
LSILELYEAKAALGIADDDTDADDELLGYVDAITGAIESYKHEIIAQRTVTQRLKLCGRDTFRLWSVPVISLTSLVSLNGTVTYDVGPTKMYVDPDSGLVDVIAGPMPTGKCKAVYEAGYAVVPANYRQGALITLQHVWETQRGVGTVEMGVDSHGDYNPRFSTYTLPRRALELLGHPRPLVG